MTSEWRARILRMPQYRSELDLVVAAPDGTLAAFCIGWLIAEREDAEIEPIGVHPGFQRLGLGHALLYEMLNRFKACRAGRAYITPYARNQAIRQTCMSVGFHQVHTIKRKGKLMNEAH